MHGQLWTRAPHCIASSPLSATDSGTTPPQVHCLLGTHPQPLLRCILGTSSPHPRTASGDPSAQVQTAASTLTSALLCKDLISIIIILLGPLPLFPVTLCCSFCRWTHPPLYYQPRTWKIYCFIAVVQETVLLPEAAGRHHLHTRVPQGRQEAGGEGLHLPRLRHRRQQGEFTLPTSDHLETRNKKQCRDTVGATPPPP